MNDNRTIEDELVDFFRWEEVDPTESIVDQLHAATADGPKFSADGSLAVIRTDPELAARMIAYADELESTHQLEWAAVEHGPEAVETMRDTARDVRALALLAAPAPADPEEDGQ